MIVKQLSVTGKFHGVSLYKGCEFDITVLTELS